MPFKVNDETLLKKYNKICEKIADLLDTQLLYKTILLYHHY